MIDGIIADDRLDSFFTELDIGYEDENAPHPFFTDSLKVGKVVHTRICGVGSISFPL